QEQSSGIEQVNLTVTQMDEATQQNAALVEEATAAARAMEEQAGQLTDAVAVFKLTPAARPKPVASTAKSNVKPAFSAAPSPKRAPVAGKHVAAPQPHSAGRTSSNAGNDSQWHEF
ncbi:chemotaxis protein, partial [Xanthomonas hortorum pv. pelargonii]|nr:chemotaxis protein [Xanthomonas hortorum pv. pelargonii]